MRFWAVNGVVYPATALLHTYASPLSLHKQQEVSREVQLAGLANGELEAAALPYLAKQLDLALLILWEEFGNVVW